MTAASILPQRKANFMPLGFGGVLFIVFLVLKLTDNIDWSWWWVTCPLWIGAVLTAVMLLVFGGIAAAVAGVTHRRRRPARR